jgi:hypothetical protein
MRVLSRVPGVRSLSIDERGYGDPSSPSERTGNAISQSDNADSETCL